MSTDERPTAGHEGVAKPFHVEGRIPRLSLDEARAAAVESGMHEYYADLAVFQVLLRHPKLANAINDLLGMLLFEGDLDDRLRELIIMRVGWKTRSVYEWGQHWRIAPRFGVTEEDLAGVREWQDHDGFGATERALLRAVDEALDDGDVTDDTWAALEAELGSVNELLEVFAAIGTWRLVSVMLRSVRVPLEAEVEPWLPDGRTPDDPVPGGAA